MGGFASVAMVLAAVGLYGVLSYSVSQRVRELGIRAALGAGRVDLVRLVMREGLSVTLAGIALGVLVAGLFARLMHVLLFGVTPLDAVAFAVAPAVLAVSSLCACLGPAMRAASTDPAATLRGTSLIRGASPLGLPYTLSRAPLRRRAPVAWLARDARSHLGTSVRL